MSEPKPCTHPVKHQNTDGSVECVIYGKVIEQPKAKP